MLRWLEKGGVGEKAGGKSLLGESLDFSLRPRRSCWFSWILGKLSGTSTSSRSLCLYVDRIWSTVSGFGAPVQEKY